jgi:hypothetical protein
MPNSNDLINPPIEENYQQVNWMLPTSIVATLNHQAQQGHHQVAELAASLLEFALSEQCRTSAGRCSIRTGQCSEGPRPLALQQQDQQAALGGLSDQPSGGINT